MIPHGYCRMTVRAAELLPGDRIISTGETVMEPGPITRGDDQVAVPLQSRSRCLTASYGPAYLTDVYRPNMTIHGL